MPDPLWLNYIGAITGVIGAVTGIAGAGMGYIAYRRSGEMKALDLRLELRKSENDLRRLVGELPAQLENAKKSHIAVASATGMLGSGPLKKWSSEWESDLTKVRSLEEELPSTDSNYLSVNHAELEAKLIAIHDLRAKVVQVQEKYQTSLARDDKEREHIRADIRARTTANLESR
jgi:hypothetical protein